MMRQLIAKLVAYSCFSSQMRISIYVQNRLACISKDGKTAQRIMLADDVTCGVLREGFDS